MARGPRMVPLKMTSIDSDAGRASTAGDGAAPIDTRPRMTNLTPSALSVPPRKVLTVLVLLSVAFAAASVFGQYLRFFHGVDQYTRFGLIDNFDVDEEANFPTYYN